MLRHAFAVVTPICIVELASVHQSCVDCKAALNSCLQALQRAGVVRLRNALGQRPNGAVGHCLQSPERGYVRHAQETRAGGRWRSRFAQFHESPARPSFVGDAAQGQQLTAGAQLAPQPQPRKAVALRCYARLRRCSAPWFSLSQPLRLLFATAANTAEYQ